MDVKLENLIEKIKKEGIEEAQQTSEELLKKARAEAAAIIDQAKEEAIKIIEDANQQAHKIKRNAQSSIRQAARDSLLAVKEEITALVNRILRREIADSLSSDFMKELILKIVEQWEPDSEKEILISNEEVEQMRDSVIHVLQEELKNDSTIKSSDKLSKGFWIGLKGEDGFYEFSDESIYSLFKTYLNPSIRDILDGQNG